MNSGSRPNWLKMSSPLGIPRHLAYQACLRQFIETEEYEKAAVVRDRIRELEQGAVEIEDDASGEAGQGESSNAKEGSGNGGEETV
jgi:hypothetical protein